VARFLNKTIKLDKIDEVLSKAETKRIGTNKDIKKLESDLEGLNKAYADMAWVDCVAVKIGRAQRIEQKIKQTSNERLSLEILYNDVEESEHKVKSIPDNLDSVLAKIATTEAFDAKIQAKEDKWSALQNIIERTISEKIKVDAIPKNLDATLLKMGAAKIHDDSIEKKVDAESNLKDLMLDIRQQQKAIKNLPDEDDVNRALTKILFTETFDVELERKIDEKFALEGIIADINDFKTVMKIAHTETSTLTKQLPSLCPTCGQSLKGDTCESRGI
jgi:phage gp46-like protein